MEKNSKIYGLLGLARRAGKISFGTESVKDTIERNKAKLIIIANDSSERTKKNFEILCKNYNIELRIIGIIEELSKAIGQTNKAVLAIKDENFSKELVKIIDGGEIIG